MAFSSEVYDGVDLMLRNDPVDQIGIADIAVYKAVAALIGQVAQVFQTAGVGQRVQVDHLHSRLFHENGANEIRSDETRPACD